MNNSSSVARLEGTLVGFSSPGVCLQHSTSNRLRIFETRFSKNCFQDLSTLCIQQRATLESVKQWQEDISSSLLKLDFVASTSLASKTADNSSSLGIDCFLKLHSKRVDIFLTLHAPIMNRNITFNSSISVQNVKQRLLRNKSYDEL